MVGSVDVDMDAAAVVHSGARIPQGADYVLQLGDFLICELRGYHLHLVG